LAGLPQTTLFVLGGIKALQLPAPFDLLGYSIVILGGTQLSAAHV
jgi:hypothetical protein